MNHKLKLFFAFISYRIRRPHRNGHGIHSPFLFDFVTQVLYAKAIPNDTFRKIKALQNKLKKNKQVLIVEDFGAGSTKMAGKERKISNLARYSSTSPKYGQLLHDIIGYLKPESIIELGSCIGFGTMYMASASAHTKIYTIEGSKALHQKAKKNYAELGMNHIIPIHGNFDDVLPLLLKENSKFEFIFIDGNHKKDAVIRYLELCLPYAQSNSVIVFDDIRWSEDMQEAWREICTNKKIKISIDLFKLGIVFFNDKIIKQNFELYY